MATTGYSETGPARSYPEYYDNARSYVLDHLNTHEPQSPTELADEYGCGGDHMRATLADLANSGEIERVSRGQYIRPDGNAGDDVESQEDDTTESPPITESTADLYQHQKAQYTDESAGDDAGTEPQSPTEMSPALPVDPLALGFVLAIGVALWLAMRTGNDSTSTDSGGDGSTSESVESGGLTR